MPSTLQDMRAENRDELDLSSTVHLTVLLAEELFLPPLRGSSPVDNSSMLRRWILSRLQARFQ